MSLPGLVLCLSNNLLHEGELLLHQLLDVIHLCLQAPAAARRLLLCCQKETLGKIKHVPSSLTFTLKAHTPVDLELLCHGGSIWSTILFTPSSWTAASAEERWLC